MFQDALKKIVDGVDGGIAGLVMGFDGIPLEQHAREGHSIDITTVGMEFSFILTQVKRAAEILQLGDAREVTVKAEKLTVVMRLISPEYFLALAMLPEGNFGKARSLLRVAAPKMQSEL